MTDTPIEEYLKVAKSPAIDVLLWLLKSRDKENQISTTLDIVASECSVTKVTVNRVFQKLYAKGFLVKIRNGQYQLHKV
jgi:predicted transcriptional regulator